MKHAGRIMRIIIIVVIVAALAGVVARRKAQLKSAPVYGLRPVPVRVAQATREPIETAHDYLGVVESWQTARISSRASARVIKVLCDEGDAVQAGELLMQLDDVDIQAQIKATESTIQGLKTNRDFWVSEDQRDSKLAAEGVISAVEAETTHNRQADAVAKLETTQRNLESLRNQLRYTKLTSPFSGVVTSRDVDPGDLATPGHALLVVEDRSQLKLAFDAPQEDMTLLKEGLPVRVKDARDVNTQHPTPNAKLTHLYPSLNQARMVRAEVALPEDASFQIGAFVPLSVVLARQENAVTVPRECLMENSEGSTAVFVFKNGILEARTVKKLMTSGDRVEIEGVEPGEQVVTSTFLGWSTLASGLKAEVIR